MFGISRHIAITCPLGILSSVFSDKSTKSAHVKLPVWPQETQKPQQTQEILNFETLYKNFEFCKLTSPQRIGFWVLQIRGTGNLRNPAKERKRGIYP